VALRLSVDLCSSQSGVPSIKTAKHITQSPAIAQVLQFSDAKDIVEISMEFSLTEHQMHEK